MKCIPINNCFECPKYNHSGAFTQGGAIPLCGAMRDRNAKYGRRELPFKFDENTGKRTYDGVIPKWCPLPSK
jgi:hypothetical protein